MNKYVLGLYLGDERCSAIVVDKVGNVIGEGSRDIERAFSPHPGWAEQDSTNWWTHICESLRDATKESKVDSKEIAALGITAQRRTFMPIDKKGSVLRPAIHWSDTRTQPSTVLRIRWLEENESNVSKKTHKYLGVQAWLAYQLTGMFTDSMAAQFASELQDPHTWDWNHEVLEENTIPLSTFPELRIPGEELGQVSGKVASETGLPASLPVIAGSGDIQSSTMGAGCFGSDKLMISYGSTLTMGSTTKNRPSYPLISEFSGIPFSYDSQFGMSGGLSLSEWFLKQFPSTEEDHKEKEPMERLLEDAAKVPPGSQGLCVLPHWWRGRWGQVIPHSDDRGVVIGWKGHHTRAHFFRAILEGIVQEVRTYKELMERNLAAKFVDVRIGNVGSKSDIIMQMTADILGHSVSRIQTAHIGTLGAAMNAAKGGGIYKSVEEAVVKMARVVKTFEPIPANHELYDKLFRGVHKKLYWTTRDINATIHDLGL